MAADFAEELALQAGLFRAQDEERFKWMNAFQTQVEKISREYKDSCGELEGERTARRAFLERIEKLERKVQDLQQSIDDGAFILVLIDADADAYMVRSHDKFLNLILTVEKFRDSYYLDPDGGRKAANDLQTQVKDYIGKIKPELARLPVVIRAYANIDGMSSYLSKFGLAQSSATMWSFAKAFSQAHAGSDFVFVGSGKDRADKKIKGVFKQFVRNPACCHIVFGACHDNGYVRTLEDFTEDSALVTRITLVHSFSVGKEFRNLPFQSTTMDIFRTSLPSAPEVQTPNSGRKDSMLATSHGSSGNTWASLARAYTSSLKENNSIKAPYEQVLVNAAGDRIDVPLPKPPQAATTSWNHKTKVVNMRYCRLYQLIGNCSGGCSYSHGPLSDDEKLVYRSNLRFEVCRTGLDCRDAKCFYGHNCSCKKQFCKFPKEMHGVCAKGTWVV